MLDQILSFEPYSHFLISIALGMLVGLQREWADTPAAGIRTFTFVTLFGTSSALIAESYGQWFVGIGMVATLTLALVAHYQRLKSEGGLQSSMVTGVTMLLMFIVGLMVRSHSVLAAAALACLVAMILHVKLELHALADKVTSTELSSVMQFLLLVLVILPLMPDQSFGPNDALNLRNIWLMVILIVGISLFGYILQKLLGDRYGVIGGGLIGGLISSTATTFSSSRMAAQETTSSRFHGLVILIAWLLVYIRAFFEIRFVSADIPAFLPLSLTALVSIIMIILSWKKHLPHVGEAGIKNAPIDLKTAVFFASFYALLISLFSYFRNGVGDSALYVVTFIAGMLDIDAITLTTARMVEKDVLEARQGVSYVFIALFSNTLFKGCLCWFIARKPLFKVILVPWVISLVLQAGIIFWYWQ